MNTVAVSLVALVACLHAYFMVMECFLWTRPRTRKTFGLSEEFVRMTKAMAFNQGLYNGFLAAGLVWALFAGEQRFPVGLFFLSCVVIAGIVGGVTVHKRIFFAQAVPAIAALLALVFGR